jgi:hypothetical protein
LITLGIESIHAVKINQHVKELKMIYAHIYKAPKSLGKYRLMITTGAAINEGVVSESYYPDLKSAKAAAVAAGAKAWNY